MLPVRDHNPSEKTPFVTYTLLVLNIGIFLSYWGLFSSPAALQQLFMTWGLVPAILAPETFVTAMFLHGSLMHLAGNMLFLWIFGDNMEDEFGHVGFLLFYLAGGLSAAVLQVLTESGSTVPMVGASGAIAAVLGGYLLLFPKARVDVFVLVLVFARIIPVPAWLMLGLWFAFQLVGGFASVPGAGGTAYWAHAGGFVTGLILAIPLWLRRGATEYWARTQGHPPHPEATYRIGRSHIPTVRR